MLRRSTTRPVDEPVTPGHDAVAEPATEPELPPRFDPDARWEERVMDERVRDAVRDRRFHLHYQPVVSVAGGEAVGIEALLRLTSDVGRVRAEKFLPILDAAHLWGEVGTWVLEEATRQAQSWAARGLWLAVNISPQQVEAGYAQGVLSSLAATGFPPDFLCLELTGTAGLSDAALAWAELRAVKTQGVRLLIDDFGTAGSSIADLVQFRLDGVKIAPTFVAGLGSEAEAEAIVSALVGLAHALDMQTIAEGVETEAQLARLRALGCDLAQGYLFQHPGDAATIAAGHLAGLALGRGAVRNP